MKPTQPIQKIIDMIKETHEDLARANEKIQLLYKMFTELKKETEKDEDMERQVW